MPATITYRDPFRGLITIPYGTEPCEYCFGAPKPATRTELWRGVEQKLCDECWQDAFGDEVAPIRPTSSGVWL